MNQPIMDAETLAIKLGKRLMREVRKNPKDSMQTTRNYLKLADQLLIKAGLSPYSNEVILNLRKGYVGAK